MMWNSYSCLQDTITGGKALVMACGPSAYALDPPEHIPVIGLNDCEHYQHLLADKREWGPDVLFIFDTPDKFTSFRTRSIAMTRAKCLVLRDQPQMREWADIVPDGNKRIIWVEAGAPWQKRKSQRNRLCIGKPSPWVGVMIAEHMGATDIGIIGMDLIDHMWGRAENLAQMERHWGELHSQLQNRGVEVWNLSKPSILKCLPKKPYKEWIQ